MAVQYARKRLHSEGTFVDQYALMNNNISTSKNASLNCKMLRNAHTADGALRTECLQIAKFKLMRVIFLNRVNI